MQKIFRLFLIFIILLAAAVICQLPFDRWYADIFHSNNFLAQVDIDQVNKIQITQDNQDTILLKQDEAVRGDIISRWKIDGVKDFYAEQSRVDDLLEKLREVKELAFVLASKNNDRQDEFGMGEEAVVLKLYSGDKLLADFIIGKISNDYSANYLKLVDSDKVYAVGVLLKNLFSRADWRDLEIFNFDQEKVERIRFQYPNREFTVEKTNGVWTGVSPYEFTVAEEKINEIIEMLASFYAVMIPEQDFAKTGLEKHAIIMQISGDNLDNTIMVGDENDDGFYYAKRADSDNIYLITKEQRDILDKQIWQLQ